MDCKTPNQQYQNSVSYLPLRIAQFIYLSTCIVIIWNIECQNFLFEGEKPSHGKLLPTAVPSQFHWTAPQTPTQQERKQRASVREGRKRKFEEDLISGLKAELAEPYDCFEEVIEPKSPVSDDSLTKPMTKVLRDSETQTEGKEKPLYDVEKYVDDHKFIHFYTGLDSYFKMMFVLTTLGPAAYSLNYLYHTVEKLSVPNQFFMTLIT